jgi:hypothetical protein
MNLETKSAATEHGATSRRSKSKRGKEQNLLIATRYASLEPASLDAAIRDGLRELLPALNGTDTKASEVFVHYRNFHGVTVTVEIGVPIAGEDRTVQGTIKRQQMDCRSILYPSASVGLRAIMDRVAEKVGQGASHPPPECWQTFALPFTGYDVNAPLCIGSSTSRPGA